MALANHRKAIRNEIALHGDRLRKLQEEAIQRHFAQRGIQPKMSPGVVVMLMSSVGLTLLMESVVGMQRAHAETEALVEAYLDEFEAGVAELPRASPGSSSPA
jgi:hypothetical protein